MDKNNLIKKINKAHLFFRFFSSKLLQIYQKKKVFSILVISIFILSIVVLVFFQNKPYYIHRVAKYQQHTIDSLTIETSLEELNKTTPVNLKYNKDVKIYIDTYLNERRGELEIFLGRSTLYFPIIESYLDKYDLPVEIKYLAVVESGLNPLAKSKSGASGLWQLLYSTCSLVDLEVNSYIDERRDIYKSTDAACRYLQYLHRIFNDWPLAIAAYNCGPGEIKKAIERSGKTDFWEIRPYLPRETANYVPTFIAFNYLFANYKEHKLDFVEPEFTYDDVDTILINKPLYFKQIAKVLNIPEQQIAFLNPLYKTGYIPATENRCLLVLYEDDIINFIRNENEIYNSTITRLTYFDLLKDSTSTDNRKCYIHVVQNGDFCHKLAMKYNCTIENIMAWNNLEDGSLYPGQQLKIWIYQ